MADKPFPFSVCEQCCVGSDGDGIVNITVNSTKDKITVEYSDGSKKEFALIGNGHKHKIADISDYKVDEGLNGTSTNPLANYVITNWIEDLLYKTEQSVHRITIDGEILTAYDSKGAVVSMIELPVGDDSITVDDELSRTSENPVQNKIITNALGGKFSEAAIMGDTDLILYREIGGYQLVKVATPSYVDNAIGDIETALENIIAKYGLGGDAE